MKYPFVKFMVGCLGMLGAALPLVASEETNKAHIYAAGAIPYENMAGAGGPQVAVLFGDPSKAGPYVTRLKLPAGAKVPPHYHNDELKIGTLIEGSIGLAYGEQYDESALKWLKPGAIWTEPKGQAHFGLAGADGAVVELHGIGPVSTIPVE